MKEEKIISDNARLGLETRFFSEPNGALGYTENGVIYLNTAFGDLEKTNKHEVLHHYEDSPSFLIVKDTLFNILPAEERERLYQEYYLRYAGLYSQEEIDKGILDNEIAIDMIIGNGEFMEEIKGVVKDVYELITRENISTNVSRRYLNLSLTTQIEQRFAQCTTWEKLFILNFYDGKNHQLPTNKESKYKDVRADIEKELERLYAYAENPENFVIDIENNKELEREYLSEIKALEARGEGQMADYCKTHKVEAMREIAERIATTQQAEYKHIVDFIKSTEYEPAFKYLMLNETLSKTYKQEKDEEGNKTIVKKREEHKSLAGHMTLNETVLRTIYNNLKDYTSFANLYFAGISLFNQNTAEKSGISLAGIDTFGMGKWLKFEGKQSNEKEYIRNAQNLASLVQNTPWCTKNLASSQLEQGDFFVFVDNSGEPHIAVKMNGNEIDEVRGIKNGNEQALEDDYRKVAIEFLTKNKDIKHGKEWLEKEEWNNRLINYSKEIEEGKFDESEVDSLLYDLFQFKDYKAHFNKNSNKTKLISQIGNSPQALNAVAKKYNCKPEQIAFGGVDFLYKTSCNYVIIFGKADFRYSQITNLGNLQSIGGYANFTNSQVTSLGNLQSIGGHAYFRDSQITSLGNLQSIGGNADFRDFKIKNLGNLQSIGGFADFENSQVTSLGNLQSIGGDADFRGSKITSLGNLQSIGGDAYFGNSQITDLGNLQSIGDWADFENSQVTNLGNLQSIGGDAYFVNSQITDLGNLEYVGGDLYLRESKVVDLGKLKYVGGELFLSPEQEELFADKIYKKDGKIYFKNQPQSENDNDEEKDI